MALAIKFVKGVRNHWKKSTFAVIALTYGSNYAKDYYDTLQLMRHYCDKAIVYGQEPIPVDVNPRVITVILNPNANRRKATKYYEKYCAPILNLAGICVDVIQTESEGQAKTLVENLSQTDAIVVAGGDGTLSEVVTGLLRKAEQNNTALDLPIGVLPLGRSNTVGNYFFPGGSHLQTVKSLADASLAVVQEFKKSMDVMKIEVLENEEETEGKAAVYAVTGIHWGAFRDAQAKQDKYWYFGPLRKYATYLFNGNNYALNGNYEATINYSVPCKGCSHCKKVTLPKDNRRWYQRFLGHKTKKTSEDFSSITNEQCREIHEKQISTTDLALFTTNAISDCLKDEIPKLHLNLGADSINYIDFVSQGWQSENGRNRPVLETIEARQVEIKPKVEENKQKECWFSIDNEEFEVKPVRITLLPKVIEMFCKKDSVHLIS